MKETLEFLAELAVNNNKEWFDANRDRYQACRDRFVAFSTEYIARLTKIDPTLEGLQPKDCIWRIYRDIRFSHDKRPYKEWFGVFPAAGVPGQPKTWGKKSMRGGFCKFCFFISFGTVLQIYDNGSFDERGIHKG